MDAFRIFDADKNRKISAEELQKVLVSLGCQKCSLKECRKMIKGVDRKGDGAVDFEEFRLMMTKNYKRNQLVAVTAIQFFDGQEDLQRHFSLPWPLLGNSPNPKRNV
ncbi:hypothetical protein DVH24_014113 [Malus domestica]|uniref:EF-hand domain-containing protein n=1 Tax=Malus domestica TaxID=3750 RepID=A0A498JFG2_MALDO|nr:hypothetical protein DVH24_014113 [Malus domestica]